VSARKQACHCGTGLQCLRCIGSPLTRLEIWIPETHTINIAKPTKEIARLAIQAVDFNIAYHVPSISSASVTTTTAWNGPLTLVKLLRDNDPHSSFVLRGIIVWKTANGQVFTRSASEYHQIEPPASLDTRLALCQNSILRLSLSASHAMQPRLRSMCICTLVQVLHYIDRLVITPSKRSMRLCLQTGAQDIASSGVQQRAMFFRNPQLYSRRRTAQRRGCSTMQL